MADRRQVFVVHGRNDRARRGLFAFLQTIGLNPIEWSQAIAMTGEASPYIGRILDVAFASAQAIVVLMTPDEITYLRSEYADSPDDPDTTPMPQVRPNVLFEAGIAMGRDPARVVLVEFGTVRRFSDIAGRHVLKLDGAAASRKELAQRLSNAGCEVDLSGTDWLSVGDLTPPPPPGQGLPLGKRLPVAKGAGVRLDLNYHDRGSGDGRLEIINRGSEPVFRVNLEIPPDAGVQVLSDDLPLAKLPPGKSAKLLAVHHGFGGNWKDHVDIRVTGETGDGTPIAEEIFVSLRG